MTLPSATNLVIHPTTRSAPPASLALSSRNAYLSPAGLAAAPTLHRALSAARTLWASEDGATAAEMQQAALAVIKAEESQTGGLVQAEYIELFHPSSFGPPAADERLRQADGGEGWVLAGAMRCDGVRLIDNLLLDVDVGGQQRPEEDDA
jgi:pantoate--beta-alanine ligase